MKIYQLVFLLVFVSCAAAAAAPPEQELIQSARLLIAQAEKAMEAPFQTSFNPQAFVEKSKAVHAALKKDLSPHDRTVLQQEANLLDLAVEYFKIVAIARPGPNALAVTRKQYQAENLKKNFQKVRAEMEKNL